MAARLKIGLQALTVAVVLGLLALLIWRVATDRGHSALKGPAPGFSLPRLDTSGKLRLASLRGKAVVLNFWASWCNPCKQEAPNLTAAHAKWRGKNVVFVGVDAQDFTGDARRFMRKYGVTYPVVHDGPGDIVGKYGVTGFPETFFVDPRGRIVRVPDRNGKLQDRILGPASEEALNQNIRRALAS